MSPDAYKDPGVNPFLLNVEIQRAVAGLNCGGAIELDLAATDIWIDANSAVFFRAVSSISELGTQDKKPFKIGVAIGISREEILMFESSCHEEWLNQQWVRISFGPLGPPYSENLKTLFDPFFFPNAKLNLSLFIGCIKGNGGLLNVVGDARSIVIHAYHRVATTPGTNQNKGTSNV